MPQEKTRKKTIINRLLSIVLIILVVLLIYLIYKPIVEDHTKYRLSCKADIRIENQNLVFRGVFSYKKSPSQGVAKVNGFVTTTDGKEFTVRRTIFFTQTDFGNNPVWTSNKIIISNSENIPAETLEKIIPQF